MAHFAKVIDGTVVDVITGDDDLFTTNKHIWVVGGGGVGQWIQASYNTHSGIHWDPETGLPSEDQSKALRKNFPGIGWKYMEDIDAFVTPQPYPSWTLDEQSGEWVCPVEYPITGIRHVWDEENQEWVPNPQPLEPHQP